MCQVKFIKMIFLNFFDIFFSTFIGLRVEFQDPKLPEESLKTSQQHFLPLRFVCESIQGETWAEVSYGEI